MVIAVNRTMLILMLVAATSGPVTCATPEPGFVTVIGSALPGHSHADRGAPVPLQALALKYSGAELGYCNISQNGAIDPLIASGRQIAVFAWTNQSEVSYYYNKGIRLFIFGNEPDGDPGTYGSILQQAYPVFQSQAPGSTVIAGNCFGTSPYITLYQNHNFKNNCDQVGFHCYSDEPATGIAIGPVVSLHNIMNTYGDGAKKIFLGEGWGPKREVRSTPRVSPHLPPTLAEIEAMRGFVVNGWNNLSTSHDGYDPNWVYGVLFFTLSDNWGFNYAHFYNGGLIDLWGNPKDDLLLLFPGNKLTVANCGFEYYSLGIPGGAAPWWQTKSGTPPACYAIDASIRRAGLRSQRIELAGTTEGYVSQTTAQGSVTAGQQYTFAAHVKTDGIAPAAYASARLKIRFLDSAGSTVGSDTWSSPLTGTNDWTLKTATAVAPANAVRVRIECNAQGTSGIAWFDDCSVSNAATPQKGGVEGYVLKSDNTAISGATVSLQPGGATTTSGSTGWFSLPNLDAGVYDVSAIASGHSRKTVTRVVVAPGRTSIAGLQLAALPAGAPANVDVSSRGVSGVLKLSWDPPSGGADYYRIYRSTTSGALGARVFDNLTALHAYDENLTDFQTYYYTVRAVKNGSESTNTNQCPGVPTGGSTLPIYDTNADPDWSNNAAVHGQTFTAPKSGSVVSATCVLANSASPNYRAVTFSVLAGGPGGAQIGPSKAVTCYFNEIGTAQWTSGEVPVAVGQVYYLRLSLNSSASMYRTKADVVSGGRYYMNDSPYSSNVDMWSTITLAENCAPDILNVAAANSAPGEATITWETTAPTTSQVLCGPTTAYGSSSALDPATKGLHKVVLPGLAPGSYHFCVKSARPGLPDASSLDYKFTIPPYPPYSLRDAKSLADGALVRVSNLVVCAGSSDFADCIQVVTQNRVQGIVVCPASQVAVNRGQMVEVQGKMDTLNGCRRIIDAVVT